MEATLFPLGGKLATDADLEYYATPSWFAEILMDRYFSRLGPTDLVLEPAAGNGHFLSAVPADVPAFGIEIDVERAAQARIATGRPIIAGDFRTVQISCRPTAVISNPPFSLVAAFLDRAYAILPEGGIAGFLMPTHLLSYSRTVCEYAERWSITVDAIPRDIFRPVMHFPISFAVFSKDRLRRLVGLSGFAEAADVRNMDSRFRAILNRAVPRSCGATSLSRRCRSLAARRPWPRSTRSSRAHAGATRGFGARKYVKRSRGIASASRPACTACVTRPEPVSGREMHAALPCVHRRRYRISRPCRGASRSAGVLLEFASGRSGNVIRPSQTRL